MAARIVAVLVGAVLAVVVIAVIVFVYFLNNPLIK